MIYLIVGHRGVGKTLWIEKIKTVLADFCKPDFIKKTFFFLDLDEEIEKKTGKTIDALLSDSKNCDDLNTQQNKTNQNNNIELAFRLMEQKTLNELIGKYKDIDGQVFIAVGAGFEWNFKKKIHPFCHIIHLIRETDSHGRVFLDRPRLRINKKPYEEYMSLYPEREKIYQKIKDESFMLPEQDFEFKEAEKFLFSQKSNNKLNAIITLNKNSLPSRGEKWQSFIDKRLSWGLRFFELRDDQLSSDELNLLLKLIPAEKQLLSFRKPETSCFFKKDLSSLVWDWPIEKGSPSCLPPIVSLHERKKEDFDQLCKQLLQYKAGHFKLAVPVRNFKELMQGHLWFLENPEHRSFLPVSVKENKAPGLWRWYRQIFGPLMKLHFIRESQSEIPDQPFLYEHLISISVKKNNQPLFAAVFGDPVIHSASPAFHRKFFAQYGMVFTKITMNEKEFTKQNLYVLQKMGLAFAVVTSPLKKKAFQICDEVDFSARSAQSVNTLVFKNQKWLGSSTDRYGLQALLKEAGINEAFKNKFQAVKNQKCIVVWGGGGMKKILEKQLPFASFYSARTGQKLIGQDNNTLKQQEKLHICSLIVVWAVGRNRMPSCVLPPVSWKTRLVVDLNYTEDSPGLEYALMAGAKYVSGKLMFKYQAKKQQEDFLKAIKS